MHTRTNDAVRIRPGSFPNRAKFKLRRLSGGSEFFRS